MDIAEKLAVHDTSAADFYQTLMQTIDRKIEAALPAVAPQTTTLWFTLSSGSTAALATTVYIEAPIDFPCIITGHTTLSRDSSAIVLPWMVLSLRRASYTNYPTFSSIVASTPPTLTSHKVQDADLVDWTTQINAGDILAIGITSNAGALTTVSIGLRVRKLGTSA